MVLAVAWAVYLIPKALKHHDEVARTRSIDRFSTAMRVLARREPVNRRDSRLVVTPPRPAGAQKMLVPTPVVRAQSAGPSASAAARHAAARRAAARAAARRRRRILSFLLVADVVVAVLAALAVVPWLSFAAPVVLTVAYLVLCRTQVRRANDASWTRDLPGAGESEVAPRRAIRVDAAYGASLTVEDDEISPDEDTVALSAAAVAAAVRAGSLSEADAAALRAEQVQTVAVTVPTEDGGSLWDPLPVTLPTYVGKQKAARTVRTINLGEPGAWTSGRSETDSRLVEEAAAAEESAVTEEQQRAVGS